ncbi:MAG: cysteine hydrolase [Deltaproteobacteria bacterium]|nr:cysteine hydrolase [Deltaproteobacteria bacterium]MBI3386460.1 cysteine hydrolase [Deltaproteobacteria bacterium]
MSDLVLDRGRCAVVVIECQNDLIHESKIGVKGIGGALATAVRDRGVLPRISQVLQAARAAGVPVLYANKESRPGMPTTDAPIFRWSQKHPMLIEGTWGAAVHDAIAPQPGDHVLRRVLSIDASYGSGLYGTLRALQRDTLIALGVSTNFAVEGTVRGAVNRLFRTVVVGDCCASVPEEMHRFSVERILSLLGTVTTSDAVIAALRQTFPSP